MPEQAIIKVDSLHGLKMNRQYPIRNKAIVFLPLINRKRAIRQKAPQKTIYILKPGAISHYLRRSKQIISHSIFYAFSRFHRDRVRSVQLSFQLLLV